MQESRGVSRAVHDLLLSKPVLLTALSMGVVNYSALARALKGEVERRLGREVSEAAVKVALIRLREQLSTSLAGESVLKVIAESATTLVDDVGLVTVRASDPLAFASLLSGVRARLLQITQGVNTLTIVTDSEVLEGLLRKVNPRTVEAVYKEQAAVILVSPREIITTPGVMAYLTTLLALNGINITQVISTHTDTLFILGRNEAIEAYSLLRSVIDEARRTVHLTGKPSSTASKDA
jgi:aspartokinase